MRAPGMGPMGLIPDFLDGVAMAADSQSLRCLSRP